MPAMTLNFPDTILLSKANHFEGLLNWNKIDGMVSNSLSSCSYFAAV